MLTEFSKLARSLLTVHNTINIFSDSCNSCISMPLAGFPLGSHGMVLPLDKCLTIVRYGSLSDWGGKECTNLSFYLVWRWPLADRNVLERPGWLEYNGRLPPGCGCLRMAIIYIWIEKTKTHKAGFIAASLRGPLNGEEVRRYII